MSQLSGDLALIVIDVQPAPLFYSSLVGARFELEQHVANNATTPPLFDLDAAGLPTGSLWRALWSRSEIVGWPVSSCKFPRFSWALVQPTRHRGVRAVV